MSTGSGPIARTLLQRHLSFISNATGMDQALGDPTPDNVQLHISGLREEDCNLMTDANHFFYPNCCQMNSDNFSRVVERRLAGLIVMQGIPLDQISIDFLKPSPVDNVD